MKTTIAKRAVGVLGASGLGVGGYYGISALNGSTEVQKTINSKSPSLSDQLKKESYVPITSNTNNSHIETILNNYKNSSSNTQELKFAGFSGENVGNKIAKNVLLEKCNAILNNENASTQDQKKAKKWCVEPTDISTLLKARGTNLLNADNNSHHAQWSAKIKKYRSSTEPKISDLTFANKTEDPTEDEIGQIKTKCKNIGTIKNHDDKFEETLKLFAAWCSE